MTDHELESLRKKVKDKKESESIETEKQKLRDELQEGTIRSGLKKVGKNIFKKLMK